MKTNTSFVFFLMLIQCSLSYSQSGDKHSDAKTLVNIKKIGILDESDNYDWKPTLISFQQGFLSVELTNGRNGVMHYVDTKMDHCHSIPLKPLFEALGMGRNDLIYLGCLATDNDVIYFIDYMWIVSAKMVNYELHVIKKVDLSLNVSPRFASCNNNKLYCIGHVQWKNEYKVWLFDTEELGILSEETLLDKQAGFNWCQPSKRYISWEKGKFLFVESTDYVIRSYSCESHQMDTLIHQQWPTPFPSDFQFIINDNGKSNCQRLSETGHEFLGGVTSVGSDTLVVTIWEGMRAKRRDTFVLVAGKWSLENSVSIVNAINKESYNTESYIRHNSGLDVMGYYKNGYMYFVFHGPNELPNGESYTAFQEKIYRYLKRNRGYIYLSKWKVNY